MAPLDPSRRRADDDRLDGLIGQVSALAITVGVVANDIGYLKATAGQNAQGVRAALERLSDVTADAAASAAGRELLRRVGGVEETNEEQNQRLKTLEDFKTEVKADVRATLRLFRILASGVALSAGSLGALWTLHLLGFIK